MDRGEMNEVTIAMRGRLQLSIDGSDSPRPLDVAIEDIRLDLDHLMDSGALRILDDDKVEVTLKNVTLRLSLDADEVLSRGGMAIVEGFEESL